MEKIHITTTINAPREKVWDTMFDQALYKEWTAAFHPGSYYKGILTQGEKILFLGPSDDGEGGMVSRVAEIRPYEFISFEHLGIVKNGVEDTESDEAKKWSPAFENYTFKDVEGGTELIIDQDIGPDEKEQFQEMWQRALVLLKELVEK